MISHEHQIQPEDFYEFVHLRGFDEGITEFRLTDEDLFALQLEILISPKRSPVIPGTGGIRKMRFSAPSTRKGKRGGFRVCFAVFEEVSVIVLILIYDKSEKDDLSIAETKELKKLYLRIKSTYDKSSNSAQ